MTSSSTDSNESAKFDLFNDNILSNILTHAASNSPQDFCNLRQVNRYLRDVGRSCKFIFETVSLANYPTIIEDKIHMEFHERCVLYGNVEALFRDAMLTMFVRGYVYASFPKFEVAISRGHHGAAYMYGLYGVAFGYFHSKKTGSEVLQIFDFRNTADETLKLLRACRETIAKFLDDLDVEPYMFFNLLRVMDYACHCNDSCHLITKNQYDDKVINFCTCYEKCFWHHEAALFFKSDVWTGALNYFL